jgi:prephenate dehydrogenase
LIMEAHFTGLGSLHITIAGLGLMGGSMALALRGCCKRLSGVEIDPEARSFALEHELVENVISFEEALKSDLLLLAAPVKGILAMLESIRQHNPRGPLVVMDLGSTKKKIFEAMQMLPEGCNPIGGHPMCGKETSGAENAEAGLFIERTFILSPLKRTSLRTRAMALALVKAVGGKPVFLDADEHDRLAAYASHAPYLAAAAVMQAAEAAKDERVWQVAASGFRDTTRLAASNLSMMTDILLTNPGPVLEAIGSIQIALDNLAVLIRNGDAQALQNALEPARLRRRQLS